MLRDSLTNSISSYTSVLRLSPILLTLLTPDPTLAYIANQDKFT